MLQIDSLVAFLQYGALGLTLALAFLAYRLPRKEQDRPEAREPILKHIRLYLAFAVLAMVVFAATELITELGGRDGGPVIPPDSLAALERSRDSALHALDEAGRRDSLWGGAGLATSVDLGIYYASLRSNQDMIERAVSRLTRALRDYPDSLVQLGMREDAYKGLLKVRESLGRREDRLLLVCGLERHTRRDSEWHLRLAQAHYAWGLKEDRQTHFERSVYHFLRLIAKHPRRLPPADVASVDAMARQLPPLHFVRARREDVVDLFEDVRGHFARDRGPDNLRRLRDRATELARQWAANLPWADPDGAEARDPTYHSTADDC